MLRIRKSRVRSLLRAAEPAAGISSARRDHRTSTRYLLKIPVVCAELNRNLQQTCEFLPARTLNVSEGGLLMVTQQELRSDRITVTFIDWDGTPIDLMARVIHRNRKGKQFFTGVEFHPARQQAVQVRKLIRIAQQPSLKSDLPAAHQD